MGTNVIAASMVIEDLVGIRNTIMGMRFHATEIDNIKAANALIGFCNKRIEAYTPPSEDDQAGIKNEHDKCDKRSIQ